MKQILFIGHDAGRTGAPLVMLHLLEWLRKRDTELRIDLLLLRGGELEERYSRTVDAVTLKKNANTSFAGRQIERVSRRVGIGGSKGIELPPGDYDLVVGNTVATIEYLAAA